MSEQISGTAMPRRDFLKASAGLTTAAVASSLLSQGFGVAQGGDTIRVGLIGCGHRGTGAASDCASGAEGIQIAALGDVFADRLDGCRNNLREKLGDKFTATDETCFVGFDAYQKVIASGVDMVILATPPGFRPIHFQAAIEAGKHVFMEKPVAVCPTGIRMMLAAGQLASEKGLGVVAGTQRRHQVGYVETIKRIHDGAIGEIRAAQVYWNQGGLWSHEPRDEWTDMEWQLRNWLYFVWLSGDHICEQHVHNLDIANWVMQAHPEKCIGMGGRQARVGERYGHIYDHFAIDFEYPGGAKVLSMCRQIDGCANRVGEHVLGTIGGANPGGSIWGENPYRHEGGNNPYQQEHTDLIASIRAGEPLNETQNVTESTLTAIMGRMAAYTGQEVTWDQALNSQLDLLPPPDIALGDIEVPPVPIPGQEKLI